MVKQREIEVREIVVSLIAVAILWLAIYAVSLLSAEPSRHVLINVRPETFIAEDEATVECWIYPSDTNTSLVMGVDNVDSRTEDINGSKSPMRHSFTIESMTCGDGSQRHAYCELNTTTGTTRVTKDVDVVGCGAAYEWR